LFLPNQFGLITKHRKSKIFHFFRSHKTVNPSSLDLDSLGGSILCPKDIWRYLEFIFNGKLSFQQHINFYSNKALSMVKYMKMLGNSKKGLLPYQKCLLYRIYILPITLYEFLLWYFNKAPLLYSLKELRKIQQRAVLWILGAFYTLPTLRIEAITGLIPIHLHLHKLSSRHHLRTSALLLNHAIKSFFESRHANESCSYHLFLENITSK